MDDLRDRFDALGTTSRQNLFSREMLSRDQDGELQSIVEEAARVTGTEIALVSLITNNLQIWRAHVGLSDELAAARGTDRDVSFCQVVVASDATLNVEDASRDTRIPQRLVEDLGIRAYLGVPLRSADGTLGSLCVIDTKARTFTEEQQAELEGLARRAEHRLEQMRASRRVARSTEPIFAEVRNLLTPLVMNLDAIDMSLAEASSLRHVAERTLGARSLNLRRSLDAFDSLAIELEEFGVLFERLIDNFDALQDTMCMTGSSCSLERALSTSLRLSHHLTKVSGGITLDATAHAIELLAPLGEVVTCLSVAINTASQRLLDTHRSEALALSVDLDEQTARFTLRAEGLTLDDVGTIVEAVSEVIPSNKWMRVTSEYDRFCLHVPAQRT